MPPDWLSRPPTIKRMFPCAWWLHLVLVYLLSPTFPLIQVEADYLSNSVERIQLWVFLSCLNCPQSGPGWFEMEGSRSRMGGHGPQPPCPLQVSQCHPFNNKFPARCPLSAMMFRKHRIPWIPRCSFLFHTAMFLRWILPMCTFIVVVFLFFPLWKSIIKSMMSLRIGGILK